MSKTVVFQTIQISISIKFSSIWPIYRTLPCGTTPGLSEPGSDGNEGVLCITQPHYQIVSCHIQDTHCRWGLTPLQRCSRCILQLQPTAQSSAGWMAYYYFRNFLTWSLFFSFLCSIWFNGNFCWVDSKKKNENFLPLFFVFIFQNFLQWSLMIFIQGRISMNISA